MNIPRLPFLALLFTTLLCGCNSNQPTSDSARSGGIYSKFIPARKTIPVGTVAVVNPHNGYAIIERNRAPFDGGAFLVARDANHSPTAVLETTNETGNSYPGQGVMIISGQLEEGYEVVDPGPELASLVQKSIDRYVADHTPSTVSDTTTASATIVPASTTTPAPTL